MTEIQGHLQSPDYIMLGGYFVVMLAIGLYFYRHMRGMKDYFTGRNSIPWWLSGVSFYMSSFSVAAFVFYPSLCYQYGWVGVTMLWVAVPATLFSVIFFAKKWRRARIDSPVEYIETRYSPVLRQLFAWQGVPVKIVDDGIKLFATGKFISVCSGLSLAESILGAGSIMLLYTFMGGVWAVSVTDFVQFVVLTAGILVILPLSIAEAGGLTAIFDNSPEGFFNLTCPEFGWTYVIPVVFLYALAWSSINWSLIQRYYCVPAEKDAMKVGWLVVALYIVGPPLMFFPALAAPQFLPQLADAGDVYPALCTTLLPAGMLGLVIAAMFAATMSTLSGDYNVCASVLTNDVYRRLIRP
ncbi:MAG: solute:Na+ symporter, family, partial [Candidatus Hydrogenedentes bacterium]|nr:solute:Na+ symporter, family [Candidatus Hydrogenedentota bacterium]